MLFKDMKVGYPVYLFHRGQEIAMSQGKIISVSNQRFQNPMNGLTPSLYQNNTSQQVVDVTIEDGGVQRTYTIPDNIDVTYAGDDLVLGTSVDVILHEVEATKAKAEAVIASVDKNKCIADKCADILTNWSPAFKDKKETEERFGKIESQLGEVASLVKNLVNKLS